MPIPTESVTSAGTLSASAYFNLGTGISGQKFGYETYDSTGTSYSASSVTITGSGTFTLTPSRPADGYVQLYVDTSSYYLGIESYTYQYWF